MPARKIWPKAKPAPGKYAEKVPTRKKKNVRAYSSEPLDDVIGSFGYLAW
jgi:hypothetical protein